MWQITPKPASTSLNKSYVHLDKAYLQSNPQFKLTIPIVPRILRPHPFTNQRIAVLARGPLIYCIEDVDHPWVTDHFKSLVLTPGVTEAHQLGDFVTEEEKSDLPEGETYIGITLKNAGVLVPQESLVPSLEREGLAALIKDSESVDLHFLPYWARANRGGAKHQMRVGIRTLD